MEFLALTGVYPDHVDRLVYVRHADIIGVGTDMPSGSGSTIAFRYKAMDDLHVKESPEAIMHLLYIARGPTAIPVKAEG